MRSGGRVRVCFNRPQWRWRARADPSVLESDVPRVAFTIARIETLFVIVADHCAAVAGRSKLPVAGYRISRILYAPKLVDPGVYTPTASQIDVPPMPLDILQVEGDNHFFGRSMFELPPTPQRAFISNYQSLGYMRDGKLVVLSPGRKVETFAVDPVTDESFPIVNDEALGREAIAYYQSAARAFRQGALTYAHNQGLEAASRAPDRSSQRSDPSRRRVRFRRPERAHCGLDAGSSRRQSRTDEEFRFRVIPRRRGARSQCRERLRNRLRRRPVLRRIGAGPHLRWMETVMISRTMKLATCALLAAVLTACGGMTTRERDTVVGAGVGAAVGAAATGDVGGAVGGGVVGGVIGNQIGRD
jgi:hypothetical protein